MESYKLRVPILEFLYRKPGVNLSGLPEEVPDNLEDLIRDAFDDLQRSEVQLGQHVTTLQAQNEELKAYASTVAHDLKDPLYALLLTSNLITNTPDLTQAQLKKYLGQVTSTVQHMNATINNLLLFAKVSNTSALIDHVDMDAVVAKVLDRLSYTIQEHHAQIDIPKSLPAAVGYAPWIEEVWANYLSNALKYGGQTPRVRLGASIETNGMIRYWMRDHGPGLSAEDQARLFTPFSQIESACAPGNGLGLSIVLRIVEKLGGQAGCESELGNGSLFFFTLPANKRRKLP
jgi:signal transduction histidine kinase